MFDLICRSCWKVISPTIGVRTPSQLIASFFSTTPCQYAQIPIDSQILTIGRTLYKIMWNVISILYGGNVGCDEALPVLDSVSQFFKLEQELTDWRRKLLPHLSLRRPQDIPLDNSDPNEKFRIILTLRHHNLRILLHRSMLLRFLELVGQKQRRSQDPVLSQVGSNSIHICTQLCMETITIVSSIVKSSDARRGMLGAWWFTLYYSKGSTSLTSLVILTILAFNAALVLCACYLIVHEGPANTASAIVTVDEMRAGIADAVQALQYLDSENPTANTCAKYLQKLAALVYMLSRSFMVISFHLQGETLTSLLGLISVISFYCSTKYTFRYGIRCTDLVNAKR
jgi:hypothetical protein